jgi:pimeloyl-ACP methyl ester carboxylesterase
MILEAPFQSLRIHARTRLVWIYFPEETLDTEALVRAYDGPVLVIHGTADIVIPYSQGQAVAAASRQGRLITLQNGHTIPKDTAEYQQWILEFSRNFVAKAETES